MTITILVIAVALSGFSLYRTFQLSRKQKAIAACLVDAVQIDSGLLQLSNSMIDLVDTVRKDGVFTAAATSELFDALEGRIRSAELKALGKAECAKCSRIVPSTSLTGNLCHGCSA